MRKKTIAALAALTVAAALGLSACGQAGGANGVDGADGAAAGTGGSCAAPMETAAVDSGKDSSGALENLRFEITDKAKDELQARLNKGDSEEKAFWIEPGRG